MKGLQADSSSPLYHQLMQRITADIERGTYPTGSRIPPEHELEQLYQVSRVTVRRALAELTAEGLLERKQGKGTFVSMPKGSMQLKSLHSFHDSCRANNVTPSTDVIHVKETTADKDDAQELNLPDGSRVLEMLRVCKADGVPVVLERNRFSMAYAWLQDQALSGSLYTLLREYGVEPKLAVHDVTLRFASAEEARLLEIQEGTPLVCLHEVIYDQRGRPLHNSIQLIRGERFVFRI
ncbi:MAG: GntR family transcriptional regulator [Clostridiales bacterium]|nr:GntR family transcriptional regulator [Clostridiales bacterium]